MTANPPIPPDSPVAPILERNRAKYNALFAGASRAGRAIDPAEFAAHLVGPMRATAEAVHAIAPASLEPAFNALFSVSLDLFGKAQMGGLTRTPLLASLWSRLLPAIPQPLAESPRPVAAGLSNILINIIADSPAAGAQWLEEMLKLAPACLTAKDLLNAAMVLAWRCGLPHYRQSALAVWKTLPETMRRLVVGADELTAIAELETGFSDPWWRPGLATERTRELKLVSVAGNFRGFGGQFVEPPLVVADTENIYVHDSKICCCLHADAFGTSLRPMRDTPPGITNEGDAGFTLDGKGNVRCGSLCATMPDFAHAMSFASVPHLLAVTLRTSHRVYLIAPV